MNTETSNTQPIKINFFIPKNRYYELKYFSLQYKHWKKVSENENLTKAEQTAAAVAIYKIENAIQQVNCVFDYKILMDCVTNGASYKHLVEKYGAVMPSKEVFYDAYRKYFYFLNKLKGV